MGGKKNSNNFQKYVFYLDLGGKLNTVTILLFLNIYKKISTITTFISVSVLAIIFNDIYNLCPGFIYE